MPNPPQRPWYRWHLVTWLLVLAVGAAFLRCQSIASKGFSFEGGWQTSWCRGWPLRFASWIAVRRTGSNAPTTTYRQQYDLGRAVLNDLCGLGMVAAVAFLAETGRRQRFRYSLGSLLTLTTTVALLVYGMTVAREGDVLRLLNSLEWDEFGNLEWNEVSLLTKALIVFGVGCMIQTILLLVCQLPRRLFAVLVPCQP